MLITSITHIQLDPFRGGVTLAAFCIALIVAITVHEFSHALIATSLDDPTAKRLGRLSLSPLAHLDPIGTAMILLAGFGWGKPVPVNPSSLRTGVRTGMATVALAGPVSNLIIASVLALSIRTGIVGSGLQGIDPFRGQPHDILGYLVGTIIFWNLLLGTFNLIPLAPLDGFKVALGGLPTEMASRFAGLERHGPAILLMLILFDLIMPGPGILSGFVRPILNGLAYVLLGRQLM